MVDRILLPEVSDRTLESWRLEGHDVVLRFTGDAAEHMLECVCGRCHWIVMEQVRGSSRWLALRCHTSGHTASFLIAGVPLTPR